MWYCVVDADEAMHLHDTRQSYCLKLLGTLDACEANHNIAAYLTKCLVPILHRMFFHEIFSYSIDRFRDMNIAIRSALVLLLCLCVVAIEVRRCKYVLHVYVLRLLVH